MNDANAKSLVFREKKLGLICSGRDLVGLVLFFKLGVTEPHRLVEVFVFNSYSNLFGLRDCFK